MDCATQEQTLSITRGEAPSFRFTTEDAPAGGIADWSLMLVVAKEAGSPVLLTLTTDNGGITVADADSGEWIAGFTRIQTLNLAAGKHRWEAWRADAGEDVVIARGPLLVSESVRATS